MSGPVQPLFDQAVSITIAAISDDVALPAGFSTFRLHNAASETIYINWGNGSATATASATGNMTLGSGAVEVLTIQNPIGGTKYLAAIGTGATGSLNITPCAGGGV